MKILPPDTKICPSCGKPFGCTGDHDCWCENVRINRKELLLIVNRYNDCICPDCLKKYEEVQSVPETTK